MSFMPIYLLVATAIFSLFAIVITHVMGERPILGASRKSFIQDMVEKRIKTLEQGHTGLSIQQYFILKLGCPAVMAFLSYFVSSNGLIMIVFIIMGFMLPDVVLTVYESSGKRKFEDSLVRALTQLASSLHSGMTVEQAIDSVVACELLSPDIRDDFRSISSKIKLGEPVSRVFFEYAEQTGSKDAKDVATTITIMSELGGDAGVAIEKLVHNIEDRLLYRKKRESMMSESKLIAVFADGVPILILAGTCIMMPDTIQSYFENAMMTAVFIIIMAVMLLGSVVVHRMLADKVDIN